MPKYEVEIPGRGKFDVESPTELTDAQAYQAVMAQIGAAPQQQEGVGAALKGGAKRFASTIQTGIESLFDAEAAAKAGLERQKAISEQYAPGADLEAVKRAYAERGLLPAAGEAISQIPAALAEQFPNIAAALASGRAGAIAGGRVGGVRGALVGGVTGAAAPSLAQLFGSGLERQAEEGTDISRGRALAAAVPGAALETAATFIPLGRTLVGKILGPQAEAALVRGNRAAVERMAKESLAGAAARGVGVGALAEIPTEITQQILERAQAGLDLTSDDALAEYGQAAYGAGLVGGPFGALGRVGQRSVARGEIEQEEAARRKEEARVAAEEQRLADEAEVQRKLTPEYRQELNAEIVAAKDELTQLQAVLKDKTVDAEVKKEAQARAKELAATVKEKTAELNKSAREAGVAPTLTEALAKQTKTAGAEPVIVDDFGNVLKPKTKGLTEEEVAAGYEQQAKKTLDYFAERERLLDELRAAEQERKEKADAELQQQVQTFMQQADELAEQESGPAAYTTKRAAELRKAGEEQAAQEITLNRIEMVLKNFGLRAAGLKADERQVVEDRVNEGVVDRKVTSVLGIKGLGGRTMQASEVLPNIQARIQEIEDQRQQALVGRDPLMLDNGQLTDKGYKLVAAEAKLNELNKLLGIAKQQTPEETAAEAALGPAIERAAAEGVEPEATPIQKGKAKKFYADKAIEANKQASGSFTDFTAYLDDYRRGTFFGEKGAKRDVQAASYTRAGLLRETEDARKQVVDNLINEISYRRMEQGGRPFTRNEAIKFAIDVNAILSELADRSTALPSGYFLGKIVQPAQMRGTEIVKSAEEVLTDTRDLDQRPLGAPQRAAEVLAEAVKIAKDKAIAEGKRPVRADKPLLKQQFKTQPTESQIAQGERVVNEIEQVLAGGVKEDIAAVLNQAADIIANRRANPTFLNTVDEQIDRIRTGIDKTDKPENLALFKEIKQDLDTQAAIRAFVEGEQTTVVPKGKRFQEVDVQEDLFPETVATKRATPATFQRLQKSQEVTAKREKIAEGKAKAEQIRKEAKSAKEEFDRLVSPQNIRDEKVKVLEQIQQLIAKTQREIQEGIELKKTRSPKYKQFTDELLKLSKDIDVNKLEFEVTEGGARVTFVSPEILESWARLDTRIKKAVAKVKELETLAKQAKEGSLEQRKAQAAARQQAMALKLIKDKRNDAADAIAKQKVLMQERLATGLGLPGTKVTTEFETVTAGGKEFTRKVRKIAQLENSFIVGEKKQAPSTEFAMGFGKLKEVKPGIEPKKPLTLEERKQAAEERKKQLEFGRLTPQEAYNKLLADARRQRISVDKAEAKLVAYEEGVSEGKVKENLTTHKGLINAVDKARARLKNTLNFLGTVSGANYNPEAAKKNASQKTVPGEITPAQRKFTTTQAFEMMGDRFKMPTQQKFSVDDVPELRVSDVDPNGEIDVAAAKKFLKEAKARAKAQGVDFDYVMVSETLPPDIRMAVERLGEYGRRLKGGVMPDGRVFVVVEAHNSMLDLEQTVVHELVGHYGVEAILGKDGFNSLIAKVEKAEGTVFKLAEKLGVYDQANGAAVATWKAGGSVKEGQAAALKEIIAYTMEKRVNEDFLQKAKRWLQEFVGAVRAKFKSWGFADSSKMSTSDLFYLMKQAYANFEAGKPIAKMESDGEVSLRTASAKYDPAIPENLISTVDKIVAKQKGFKDKVLTNVAGLAGRVQFLDRLAALDALVKRGVSAGVIDSLKAYDAMYFSRMADQRNNFVAEIATNGTLQLKDVTRPDGRVEKIIESKGGVSLKDVAGALQGAGVGNPEATGRLFTLYLAAERAQRVGKDKLNFSETISQKDLDEALVLGRNNASFKKARDLYNEYNKGLIEFAVETGAMSKELGKKLAATNDYVPFYRVRDGQAELVIAGEKPFRIGDIKNQPYLKELIGGDTQILDFFTSSLQNTSLLTDMALKNLATRNAAYVLRDMGVAQVRDGSGGADANTIRFKRDGQEMHAVIDTQAKADLFGDIPTELVVQGMEGIKATMPAAIRLLGLPANLLRTLVTRNPNYAIRQVFRDSMAAVLTTGADFVPVAQTLKDMATMKKSGAMKTLEARGVIGGQVIAGASDDMQKILQQISSGKPGWHMAMAKLDQFAMMGDAATRVSMYNSFVKQGLSEREATLATLEAMNFSRRGLSPSVLYANTLIPFFNAGLQGIDVLYRAFKGDMPESERLRVKQKLITRGLMMAVFTMAYAAMMEDDEAYKNANTDERYNNWFVPIPGLKEPLRVPIPFEAGLVFKGIPEGLYRLMFTDDKASDVAKAMKDLAMRSMPIDLPTAIKPAVELMLNKSFFTDREIVDAKLQGVDAAYQYRPNTPELIKFFGAIGLSPVQVEYAIRGYTGGLPVAIARIFDPLLVSSQNVKPEMKVNEFPIVGALFQPQDAGGLINRAFENVKTAQAASQTYKRLMQENPAEAKRYFQENTADIALASAAGAFRQQIGQLTKAEQAIRANPNMSAEEKRKQLDEFRKLKIELSKQFTSVSERIKSQSFR